MTSSIWALVPASGVGRRMLAERPKQYLELNGRFILDHTLERLLSIPELSGVILVLSDDDRYWSCSDYYNHPKIQIASGGDERFHSVINGLQLLDTLTNEDTWVMVHDAARPCVRLSDISNLMSSVMGHDGGLLGIPAKDTIKRVSADASVQSTIDRSKIWMAHTPQMFRSNELRLSLNQANEQGAMVTDDASAMELAGYRPLMVEGSADNIKITHPEDLALAGWYLEQQAMSPNN